MNSRIDASAPKFGVTLALTLPFFVNDFAYIEWQHERALFLVVDYATHLWPILVLLFLYRRRYPVAEAFSCRRLSPRQFALYALALSALGVLVYRGLGVYLSEQFAPTQLYAFPELTGALRAYDLSLGILAVALSEELAFRGALLNWLRGRGARPWVAVALSSLAFGAIHWGLDLGSVINSTVWAVVPALVPLRTGSLWPAVVAHYVTDAVALW